MCVFVCICSCSTQLCSGLCCPFSAWRSLCANSRPLSTIDTNLKRLPWTIDPTKGPPYTSKKTRDMQAGTQFNRMVFVTWQKALTIRGDLIQGRVLFVDKHLLKLPINLIQVMILHLYTNDASPMFSWRNHDHLLVVNMFRDFQSYFCCWFPFKPDMFELWSY